MPEQVTNFKCPNCGGPLHFDAQSQKLKCDYCDSTFTADEVEAFYKKKNEEAAQAPAQFTADEMGWTEEEAKHMRAYSCPSCGAQIVCDDRTAATSCPYCGNPTVVPAQFSGALKPSYVIPFKLEKAEAIKRLNEFYRGKSLLPKSFRDQNHIEEIKGMYVPFWLYDAKVDADMAFHATRVRSHSDGEYNITETSHYQVVRKGLVTFEKVPADAAEKMPDEYMDAIEPFDYSSMVPFEMSYMAGYLADRYDVDASANQERTDARMQNSAGTLLANTVLGYTSVLPERTYFQRVSGKASYAFLPVWVLSTRYNGKPYLFVMNGQTGKMVGDMPADMRKFWLMVLITAIVGVLLGFVLQYGAQAGWF